jgi:hypothetical protein
VGSDRGGKPTPGDVDVLSDLLASIYGIAGMVLFDIDYQQLCGMML